MMLRGYQCGGGGRYPGACHRTQGGDRRGQWLLFVSLEYNKLISGVFKNAAGWLFGPADGIKRVFGDKPVALRDASPDGVKAQRLQDQLAVREAEMNWLASHFREFGVLTKNGFPNWERANQNNAFPNLVVLAHCALLPRLTAAECKDIRILNRTAASVRSAKLNCATLGESFRKCEFRSALFRV
jgi:hypothetical protein